MFEQSTVAFRFLLQRNATMPNVVAVDHDEVSPVEEDVPAVDAVPVQPDRLLRLCLPHRRSGSALSIA